MQRRSLTTYYKQIDAQESLQVMALSPMKPSLQFLLLSVMLYGIETPFGIETQVSCPSCVPFPLLAPSQPTHGEGEERKAGTGQP